MDTSLSPSLTVVALLGIVAALALIVGAIRKDRWKRGILLALGVALLVPSSFFALGLNPWLVDARFRTFRSFYYDIEVGMSRAEVMNLVHQHYPDSGKRQRPSIVYDEQARLGIFMNPEHTREPNCEGVFLALEEGSVVSKSYSAD